MDNLLFLSDKITTQQFGLLLDKLNPYLNIDYSKTKSAHISNARWDKFVEQFPKYEKFGWVRANNVLDANQWKDFNSKFTDANKFNTYFEKSLSDELIIPVNNMIKEGFGIDNALVFAKGTPSNPNVTKIIKINLNDETDLSYLREIIYENESKGIQTKDSQLFKVYARADFPNYDEYKSRARNTQDESNNNIGPNRERSSKKPNEIDGRYSLSESRSNTSGDTSESEGDKRYSLKDNLGNKLTEEQAEFFKDSKVRDENGSLQVVYHGTEGEFYTFDKSLRGTNTGAGDAKLGFFFTSSELVAQDYAVYTQDGKLHNLMAQIAQGDPEVMRLLC